LIADLSENNPEVAWKLSWTARSRTGSC